MRGAGPHAGVARTAAKVPQLGARAARQHLDDVADEGDRRRPML